MKEWGWTNPVLADEAGGVIAGHARILAARQLGYGEVPVMVAQGWSDAQKRAYVIADNQLAITGSGWDTELLGLELGELKLGGSAYGRPRPAVKHPRWEPYAGKLPVRFCAGRAQ
jgi:hypothetical protein